MKQKNHIILVLLIIVFGAFKSDETNLTVSKQTEFQEYQFNKYLWTKEFTKRHSKKSYTRILSPNRPYTEQGCLTNPGDSANNKAGTRCFEQPGNCKNARICTAIPTAVVGPSNLLDARMLADAHAQAMYDGGYVEAIDMQVSSDIAFEALVDFYDL